MSTSRNALVPSGISAIDVWICLRLAAGGRPPAVTRLFRAVSLLGDGIIWLALLAVLPLLYGADALPEVARMVAVGLVGLGLYRWIKARTGRPRPYATLQQVVLSGRPMDPYSFPSGHTLHAVAFTTLAVSRHPELGWVLVPFTCLVALSRIVLGLHYPTDVLAGAALGFVLSTLAVALF